MPTSSPSSASRSASPSPPPPHPRAMPRPALSWRRLRREGPPRGQACVPETCCVPGPRSTRQRSRGESSTARSTRHSTSPRSKRPRRPSRPSSSPAFVTVVHSRPHWRPASGASGSGPCWKGRCCAPTRTRARGIALFREAAGQTRSRDQSSLAAWFLAQAAEALAAAERWPEALEAWAEAKAETSTDAQRASIAKAEGLALGPRHLASAEGALREALGIWRRLPGLELAVAADLNALGALALERGELAEAEALHREALALAVSVVPENLVCAESMAQLAFIGTPSSTKVA